MKDANKRPGSEQPARYQIKVRGRLDEKWSDWFNGMALTFESAGNSWPITTLTGVVADQAELRGMLSKIWDLNLTVISVTQVELEECKGHWQAHSLLGGEPWENS
jgi:hypothetical protein